jgi:hypothetical protein
MTDNRVENRSKSAILRILACVVALHCLLSGAALAEQKIQLFELRHRLPEEVLPALRPLLGPDVVVSRIGNKLVIKADRLKLAEIAETVRQLDQPARRLMIEFREVSLDSDSSSSIGLSGRAKLGDRAEIGVGRDRHEGLRLGGHQARTTSRDDITQRVQTIEGRPAYLSTGRSYPIHQSSTYSDGQRTFQQHHTDYRDATIGFYVRPQVQGDHVVLDITRHAQRLGPDGRAFSLQDAGSRVRGELGEWIDFGGVRQQAELTGRGIAYRAQTAGKNDRQYQIRVTALN